MVPMPTEPRHYLMRWNPSISSFKEKDYKECVENLEHGKEEDDDFPLAN